MTTIDEAINDLTRATVSHVVGVCSGDDVMRHTSDLRTLITQAIAEAREEGAREMREAIRKRACNLRPVAWIRYASDGGVHGPLLDAQVDGARRDCWTPLVVANWADREPPPDKREPVRLTDEQIMATLRAAPMSTAPWYAFQATAIDRFRAIETAVLAANGLTK